MRLLSRLCGTLFLSFACFGTVQADSPIVRDLPPGLHVPAEAQPAPGFDVERATEAWLALLAPEQRALSDAYYEGREWLRLWHLLWGMGAAAVLLASGASRRMREVAERASRRPLVGAAIYAALFLVALFVLELPLDIYADFVREHRYGLSNLTFARWLGEALIGLGVAVVIGSVALSLLYAAVRRAGERWWAWATGLTFAFLLFLFVIDPLLIAPLFNDYKPLPEGPVREAVTSLARANGVPSDRIEWFDASKQTTRISANVSGLWGVARINLNDNLLEKTSLPEIKAVLGHEMGHYVLDHAFLLAVYFSLLFGLGFRLLHLAFERALARVGPRLGLRDRADPAALPLAFAIFSLIWFALMPLRNSVVRTVEAEADAFGLNAAREPEGFAMAAMRLSTYRKLRPGPLEEILFYDHPSGYERVHAAMAWRKENLPAAPGPGGR